jgi:hypothetical protein
MNTQHEIEEVMDSIKGCRIEYGECNRDGAHFKLDDGRFIIFYGPGVIWVGNIEKETIQ